MAYLYGATDEKHVRLGGDTNQKKPKILDTYKFRLKKPKILDTYKFRLSPLLEGKPKAKASDTAIRFKASPDTLVTLCSPVVDAVPLPKPFQWTCEEVADWIRKLGFPQYQNTFKRNYINGRNLLRIDASYLVRINIKDFEHIQIITNSIRELYGFARSSFERNISKPDRSPDALYEFFRTRTGYKYENTRLTDLCKLRHILRPRPLYETHWQTLERCLKRRRTEKTELIGGTVQKRYNLFYPPKSHPLPLVEKKVYQDSDCMPPCMCEWTNERHLREPWRLDCLYQIAEKETCLSECKCIESCTCTWPNIQDKKDITVLKVHVPHKYAVNDMEIPFDRPVKVRFSHKSV